MHGQRKLSRALVSEDSEACFVLPRREVVALCSSEHKRSLETAVVGGSDNGNTRAGIDTSSNFGAAFLPLLGKSSVSGS